MSGNASSQFNLSALLVGISCRLAGFRWAEFVGEGIQTLLFELVQLEVSLFGECQGFFHAVSGGA